MATQMEVDEASSDVALMDTNFSNLKRSSSAPSLNILMENAEKVSRAPKDDTYQDKTSESGRFNPPLLMQTNQHSFRPISTGPPSLKPRARHNSTSCLVVNNTISGTPMKTPHRIHQLKHEDEVRAKIHREINHERETQSCMQISNSWDELKLAEPTIAEAHKSRPRSLSESLHIFTSGFPVASSPSPTRVGKQCFSPSMQQPVMFNGQAFNHFTPSPSPSPTRRVVRRSVSPIVLKPSSLGKRKLDHDCESGFSQPKRIFSPGSLLAHTVFINQQCNMTQSTLHSTHTSNNNNIELRRPTTSHCNSPSSLGGDSNVSDSPSIISSVSNPASASNYMFSSLSDTTVNTDSETDMIEQVNPSNNS